MVADIEPLANRDWEREGERIALDLDAHSALLVVGANPVAAARVALGIAHNQADRKSVV